MPKLKQTKKQTMLETVHQMAQGLHKAGVIGATTLREFDALCLPAIKELSFTQIRKIRLRE